MSIAQTDREQLRSFYFGYLRSLSMIIFPLAVGLALTAPIFIPLFLSEKWNPAIVPTTLISLALGIAAMGFIPGILYKAIGRPEILTRLNFIKVPFAVAVLWYSTRWGIAGVAGGQIVISIFSLALDTLTANYVMRYPITDLIKALTPTFVSTLAMTLALLALMQILPFSELLEFIFMIPAGVLIYFTMLWALDRETVRAGIDLFRRTFIKVPLGAGSDA
jgi:PST family polysaccharide transporter/lipopolysaccharide exporter